MSVTTRPVTTDRLPVVFVEWTDSYLASEAWTDRSESIDSAHAMLSDPIRSAGFLIDSGPHGIVVAAAVNQHADDVQGAIAIPRGAIVRMNAWDGEVDMWPELPAVRSTTLDRLQRMSAGYFG